MVMSNRSPTAERTTRAISSTSSPPSKARTGLTALVNTSLNVHEGADNQARLRNACRLLAEGIEWISWCSLDRRGPERHEPCTHRYRPPRGGARPVRHPPPRLDLKASSSCEAVRLLLPLGALRAMPSRIRTREPQAAVAHMQRGQRRNHRARSAPPRPTPQCRFALGSAE